MQVPHDATVRVVLASMERNLLPDAVIRRLTRLLLANRLRSCYKPSSELQLADLLQFVHCNDLLRCHVYVGGICDDVAYVCVLLKLRLCDMYAFCCISDILRW